MNLHDDYDVNIYIEQNKSSSSVGIFDKNLIKSELAKNKKINSSEVGINTLSSTVETKLKPQDEIHAGEDLIKWIKNNLMQKCENAQCNTGFTDISMFLYGGYVTIVRNNIDTGDYVTRDLIDLKYFTWQYDNPINTSTLKHVIFPKNFSFPLDHDINQSREASKILGLQYYISLQPKPEYQSWCLKRIIMGWYGDDLPIRKIELLINQFRADPAQEYNKKYGVLPSILIHLKYGVIHAQETLIKLVKYFTIYFDQSNRHNNIFWEDSHPDYFDKKNDLIYYSNGSDSLKLYLHRATGCSKNKLDNIFTKNYTSLLEADNVIKQ